MKPIAAKPGLLLFYRIMAYVSAILLIALCLAMVFKYGWPEGTPTQEQGDTWVGAIGFVHGWLYFIYLLIAFVLTTRLRIPLGRMLLVLLAGTIPFGAFFAERKVTRWYHARTAGDPITLDEQARFAEEATAS